MGQLFTSRYCSERFPRARASVSHMMWSALGIGERGGGQGLCGHLGGSRHLTAEQPVWIHRTGLGLSEGWI